MTRLAIALLALSVASLVAPTRGQADDSLEELLERLDERAAQIKDLTARFIQEKHSILLRDPLVSKGRVWVLDDNVKWETKEPRYSLLLVSSRAAKLYDPESKRLEVYPLSSGLAAIIGTPLPRFLRLKESFSIERAEPGKESEQVVLTLTPLNEELAEHIESITVWIDPKIPAATALEMVDPDGERTRITFSKIELDQGLSEEDFELELPDDVLIEYPMGPIPENGGP